MQKKNLFIIGICIISCFLLQMIFSICMCYIDEGNSSNYTSFTNYLMTDAIKDLLGNSPGSSIEAQYFFFVMPGIYFVFNNIKNLKGRIPLQIVVSIIVSVFAYVLIVFSALVTSGIFYILFIKWL